MRRLSSYLLAGLTVVCLGAIQPGVSHAQENASSSAESSGAGSPIGADRKIGVGLGGGTFANGLTGKFYLGQTSTIQALVGASFAGIGAEVHYVHEIGLTDFEFGRLDLHVGGGGGFRTVSYAGGSATVLGPQGVVGLGLKLSDVPLEIATEWHPGFYLAMSDVAAVGGVGLSGAGGYLRWYF